MESEKVKEIKENLQQEYPTVKFLDGCIAVIVSPDLLKDCLILINELESENERLTKQYVDWKDLYYENTKKVKKLKDRIAELEKENGRLNKLFTYDKSVRDRCFEFIKDIKEEALKQFAERLKDSGEIKALLEMETMPKVFKHIHNEIVKSIDETLKDYAENVPSGRWQQKELKKRILQHSQRRL